MFLLVPLDKWAEISGCTALQMTHYNIKQPTVGFWGGGFGPVII